MDLHLLLKTLIMPPAILLLMAFIGLLMGRRRGGRLLLWLSLCLLYLFSTPWFSERINCALATYPAVTPEAIEGLDPQAILLLGAGRADGTREYGGLTIGGDMLERTRYAAWLARRYGLPVVTTGGAREGIPSEGQLAADVLENEFGVEVLLVEDRSRTTWENAEFVAALLKPAGIHRLLVVTHAVHMPRTMNILRRQSLQLLAAPTMYRCSGPLTENEWLADAESLVQTRKALHELVGQAWYWLRGLWEGR